MPAKRLEELVVSLSMFDVVGQDGVSPFVAHVGLALVTGMQSAVRVAVHEMGPPLNAPGYIAANVYGDAELDDDEIRKIRSFVVRHSGEHRARNLSATPTGKIRSYVIYPHTRDVVEEDGTRLFTRFSCAGFTLEAYKSARIQLLDLANVPMASLQAAVAAYPQAGNVLIESPRLREELGLIGEGPWPITFCGYLIHSLARTRLEIREFPYSPRSSDTSF